MTTPDPAPAPAGPDVVLVWEFFGPHGHGTAVHYQEHLLQFLAREGIEGARIEVRDAGRFSSSVRCTLAESKAPGVERALRPKRRERPPG